MALDPSSRMQLVSGMGGYRVRAPHIDLTIGESVKGWILMDISLLWYGEMVTGMTFQNGNIKVLVLLKPLSSAVVIPRI